MEIRNASSRLSRGRMALTLIALAALGACGGSNNDTKYSIGGNTSGLSGTVVLRNNGADSLTVTASGAFTFANKVKSGSAYAVTVATQPAGQTCTVSNGSGTATANVTNVAVTCTTNAAYSVGGTVSGLGAGLSVVLRNHGGDNLTVSANGSFTFGTPVVSGLQYSVTVLTQPAGQVCGVTQNGSGTVNGANVTNVAVTCWTAYSVGGTVNGLSGGTLQLGLEHSGNMGYSIDVTANGPFNFDPDKVSDGDAYQATIQTQPAGQTCSMTNGSGTVSGANVTNITVTCTSSPPPAQTYSIGGTISGLSGSVTLEPFLYGDPQTFTTNGAFAFAERTAAGNPYNVKVLTQPAGQTCAVTNGSGTVAGANVSTVLVSCSANSTDYSIGGTITGLSGAGLRIEDTSASGITVASNATTFTLPMRRGNNYEYDVGIAAQPAGQTCVLIKSHGVIASADVTNVDVRCIANVTDPIVGTYTVPALSASRTSYVYMTLYADGVYIYGSVENNGPNCGNTNGGNGVEYGVYSYNASTGAFTIKSAVVDTNGGCGVWNNGARYTGTLAKSGTGQSTVLTLTLPGGAGQFDLVPVASTAGQVIGSWGNQYHKTFFVFLPAGGTSVYSFFATSQADTGTTSIGQEAGVEYACGSATALTGGTYTPDFSVACQVPAPGQDGAVDTNGTAGLSNLGGSAPFTVSTDTLSAGETWTRIKPN
jgi:hypothetical protein